MVEEECYYVKDVGGVDENIPSCPSKVICTKETMIE
jgi:hypothetical protein